MPTIPGSAAPAPDNAKLLQAIEAEMTRREALKAIEAEQARRAPSVAIGVVRSAAQGATFGFADEIEAGVRAVGDMGRQYFGFHADEADAAIRSLWDRGDGPGFASAARRR